MKHYEIKATSMWSAPETYTVITESARKELVQYLKDQQYIVEVSEIESED